MANIKSKAELLASIAGDMADNNAGLISAEDVRSNMSDTANSINDIVASGDTQSAHPFHNNVKIKKSTTDGTTGKLIVGSGVEFPDGCTQTECFPGATGINHTELANKDVYDDHLQYLPVAGGRKMSGNLGIGTYFINSSGSAEAGQPVTKGLGFQRNEITDREEILVSGTMVFEDKSRLDSGLATARAWANFDASPTAGSVHWSGYNVTAITKTAEKFDITFNSGVLEDNSYLAFGYSNGRSTASSSEDFDRCFVGLTNRAGTDIPSDRRTLSFAVLTESGVYSSSSKQNHVVVFGAGSGTLGTNINTGTIS
jgi:hypothetical protein